MSVRKNVDKSIGERIAIARKSARVTQQELAEAVGYAHKGSINKIELGLTGVSGDRLYKIANALHVSPEYLTTGVSIPEDPIPVNGWADKLLSLANKLTVKKRNELITFAAFLVSQEGKS